MPNQNEADPPVRSQDPFRKASDPQSRDTAANAVDRDPSVVVETEGTSDSGPDAVGLAEAQAQADAGQGSGSDSSGKTQAEQQAREAGSGTTGHEVEPETNADMNLLGFEKKRK